MPIREDHVGRSYPATSPYEVTRAKIAEFATALGDDNPAYFGERPVAPPTFAAVVTAQAWDRLFADEELGLALKRVIHADQSFEWARPLRAGDEVTATLTIAGVRTRGATDMIKLDIVVATTEGERVCVAHSQLIHAREEAAA